MVDARRPVDAVAVFGGLAEIAEQLATGAGGLPALQRTVDVTVEATAAAGAAFIEYGHDSGRVVAAAAALDWSLGRPVDLIHPTLRGSAAVRLQGPRVSRQPRSAPSAANTCAAAVWPASSPPRSTPARPPSASSSAATATPKAPPAPRNVPLWRSSPGWSASSTPWAAACRSTTTGPRSTPSAEPFALLDADHVVRAWNPAAALLTARSPEAAIGEPWPFPLPTGTETVEHQMACGTWIQIRAATVPGGTDISVSFRARADQPSDGRDLFIALTGHELRTPITVIRGYADTLVEHWDSLDDGSRREAIYVVGQRARELSRLVDRLLNAVGDDATPGDASALLPFDLVDTLTAAARRPEPRAAPHPDRLTAAGPPEGPRRTRHPCYHSCGICNECG